MSLNVSNKKCIRHLSFRHMQSARARNAIAIIAIALTTILFTSLFTIMMSIVYGYEQSTFRQVGSYDHGSFKNLTKEQFEELRTDPLIKEWGVRRYLAMPDKEPFTKSHVEISYMDDNNAKWSFLEPLAGHLPTEGTNEAATDTTVLKLLGIEPVIGTKFTLTFEVDGIETTQEFTLCGYWDYDPVIVANHILIPESLVTEILTRQNAQCQDGMTGRYTLNVMLSNSSNIEKNFQTILARHGYQSDNRLQEDTFIALGVNWAYISTQLNSSLDFATVLSAAAMLLLIIFTGYLIIYNLFQISVAGDIRFYGLLKTIGTTRRQIKRIIYRQTFYLSAIGIPIGLLIGYGVGALLTPTVLSTLNVYHSALSVSPWIFVGSALFSLLTVFLSCKKPGKMAAKVSPIEAVRYTEGGGGRKKKKRSGKAGSSIYRMAWANLGRNRKKTVISIISLSLSVVLLNITVSATNSFDLEKYLHDNKGMAVDFLVGNSSYFYHHTFDFTDEISVSEDTIAALESQGGMTDSGRTYGASSPMMEFISEDAYYNLRRSWYSDSMIKENMAVEERKGDRISNSRRLNMNLELYGMDPFCLDKLTVIDGDLSKLSQTDNPDGVKYIAAACNLDKSGRIYEETCWLSVGDIAIIRYIDELEFYNTVTGEIYSDVDMIPDTERNNADVRILKYRDIEYEVAALVEIPSALSYRYSGLYYSYVLDADTFIRDTGTDSVMYYAFDTQDSATEAMEQYISDYTQNISPQYEYESRQTFVDEYYSFTRMYLICGSALSFIIGLVGILNFFNAIMTSIMARRREFAVLASIGMTGRQLISMLLAEGVLLSLAAVIVSLMLTIATAPLVANTFGSIYTFFSYHFTAAPLLVITPAFILLGILLPFTIYRFTADKSVVERLREV